MLSRAEGFRGRGLVLKSFLDSERLVATHKTKGFMAYSLEVREATPLGVSARGRVAVTCLVFLERLLLYPSASTTLQKPNQQRGVYVLG